LYKGYFSLTTEDMFQEEMTLYASHVEEPKKAKGPSLEYFSILQEFEYVFQEILGFPPKREIYFSIDLVTRSTPISKIPYRMSTP
jgi:hypothetical protein